MTSTVTNVEIKQGTSKKNGKPYTMYVLTLDDGRTASSFEPVQAGDEVEITQQGQFLNAKPLVSMKVERTNSQIAQNDLKAQLDRLEEKIDGIYTHLIKPKETDDDGQPF